MEERNYIESISTYRMTKEDLIDFIEKEFPGRGSMPIAVLTTVQMSNGTKNQSLLLGKIVKG